MFPTNHKIKSGFWLAFVSEKCSSDVDKLGTSERKWEIWSMKLAGRINKLANWELTLRLAVGFVLSNVFGQDKKSAGYTFDSHAELLIDR